MGHSSVTFGAEMGKYIKDNFGGEEGYQLQTIVIDPGHGGKDPGASGRFTKEKNLALGIAKSLGVMLQETYPQLNILFTRSDDTFIPLYERAGLANKNKADLFLSVHCNYMPNASHVRGTETYVMGVHTAEYNLRVAKRENASILLEDDYRENYGGYDPNSPEGHIILSMFQNTFLEQSILFAEKVENHFGNSGKRNSRGVKQAGFAVLKGTTMPSVLIETGFLSNSGEEKYLATSEGQQTIARSIAQAFTEYKNEVEGNSSPLPRLTSAAPQLPAGKKKTQKPFLQENEQRASAEPAPGQQTEIPPPPTNDQPKALPPAQRELPPAEPVPAPSGKRPRINPIPSASAPLESTNSSNEKAMAVKGAESSTAELVTFKILILNTNDPASVRNMPWEKVRHLVEIKKEGAIFRYYATGFSTYPEVVKAKNQLREMGFTEAFVVAQQDGQRISIQQALRAGKK